MRCRTRWPRHKGSPRSGTALGRSRWVASLAALAVAGSIFLVGPAEADISTGYQWQHDMHDQRCAGFFDPVFGMWMVVDNPCIISMKKTSSLLAQSGWSSATQSAKDNWAVPHPDFDNELRLRIDAYTGDSSVDEQILVDARDLGDPDSNGRITLGRASRQYIFLTGTWELEHVEIAMSTNNNIDWYVDSGSGYSVPTGEIDFQSVASHEFGHGIGAEHPRCGPNSNHTMQALISDGERTLVQAHDRDALFYMYGDHDESAYGPRVPVADC